VYFSASQRAVETRIPEPNPLFSGYVIADRRDKVPAMRRLISPVNAGVSAARHLLWFVRYHTSGSQRPPS
jgi:hypothetical protein